MHIPYVTQKFAGSQRETGDKLETNPRSQSGAWERDAEPDYSFSTDPEPLMDWLTVFGSP